MPAVYVELKQMAQALMARESPLATARVRLVLVESEILLKLGQSNEAQRKLVRAYRVLSRRQGLPDRFEYSVPKQLSLLFQQRDRFGKAALWEQRANSIREVMNK